MRIIKDADKFILFLSRFAKHLEEFGEAKAAEAVGVIAKYVDRVAAEEDKEAEA